MAKPFDYFEFVTSSHDLYNRYFDTWRLAVRSFWGGVEYRDAQYLKAYGIDYSTPSDTINTYDIDDDGNQIAKYKSRVYKSNSQTDNELDNQYASNFYQEKLQNVPVLPYTRLYVSEYNAILFRSPPVRELPDTPEINAFLQNVDGEGNSANEFMSQVDTYSTVYGVVWVSCIKTAGAPYARWRWHSPLDVTNWQYGYDINGDLTLNRICVRLSDEPEVEIYMVMTPTEITTIFIPQDGDVEFEPPEGAGFFQGGEDDDQGYYMISQPNEMGRVSVSPVYQSNKIYNGIGHTPIFDIAQLQRSIYGDFGEIYSSLSYGAHPVSVIDETTLSMNDFNVSAEPGSTIQVQSSLNGQPNYVFEFKAPPLDSLKEIREIVDQKIEKMNQIAMIRSDDLIKASRSGVQIEQYDSKLEAFIRKKATSLENLEASVLWPLWFEWEGQTMPEDVSVSYNRLYTQKGLENEIKELNSMLTAYENYQRVLGADDVYEAEEYTTAEQAEARAVELGGSGFHSHTTEDGTTIYMPFTTHEEYDLRRAMATGDEPEDFKSQLKEMIRERLTQLVEGSYTKNSL